MGEGVPSKDEGRGERMGTEGRERGQEWIGTVIARGGWVSGDGDGPSDGWWWCPETEVLAAGATGVPSEWGC